jgi:uncharacterized protein DUF6677
MATARKKQEFGKALYLAAILAWLVPGAGHWYLGKRSRGAIIFLAICSTFLIGLYLGGLEMINPQGSFGSKAWFCAQILTGLPGLIAAIAQDPNIGPGYGRGVDLGQVYTGIAGLLNLLCILDVLTTEAIGPINTKRKGAV